MEPKEAKIARKILKFFPSENFEVIYHKFVKILKKNSDYFNLLPKESLIKILFYVESLKTTGDIKKANQRLNNLEFINLFYKTGEKYNETCDQCYGDNYVECDECRGSGTVECATCQGEGEVMCKDCDGSGADLEDEKCETCDGHGAVRCDWCDGDGKERCGMCSGQGSVSCENCDGGEVETDRDIYSDYFVVSWNPKFNNLMKDLVELEKPWGDSDEFFEEFNNDFLILYQSDVSDHELKDEVEDGLIYPYKFDDSPLLLTTSGSQFFSGEIPRNFIK